MTLRCAKPVLAATALLTLCGCSLMPEWRVGQKRVPASIVEKPAAQIEGERKAAAYIDAITSPPVPDPASIVAKVHAVSGPLSASLGQPAKPVVIVGTSSPLSDAKANDRTAADIVASLNAGLAAKEKQLDQWKAFGRKYAGTPLEGTGIDLAGPAGIAALAGIVALCIAFPAFGYIALRVIPLLWGFFRSTTSGIADFIGAHPRAAEDLKLSLSRKMDTAHKRLVKRHSTK